MNVNEITLPELQRQGLRGLRNLSSTQMDTLYSRFGRSAIDSLTDVAQSVAPDEFKPAVGAIIGGKWKIIRFAGNFEGEAQFEVTKADDTDDNPVVFTRSMSRLYQDSLNTPPDASALRAMSGTQYKAALKKFGEKRLNAILEADAPKPLSADERESVVVQTLSDHWQHVVQNHRGIEAISTRLEGCVAITPADVDNAVRDAVSAGEIPVDLRMLGLADKYQFDVVDNLAAIQRLSGDDFARVTNRFHEPAKHWADGLTSDQFRAHLDANDRERGIEAPIPAVIRDRQAQTVATFRQIHPELEFENLSGADKIVNWLKETKRALTIQNMEIARQELLEAKAIMGVDGSQKVKYGATTLVDAGGHPQAQRVVPTRENVVVENTPKKWTRDQIRRMSSEEYSSHLSEPGFASSVDEL